MASLPSDPAPASDLAPARVASLDPLMARVAPVVSAAAKARLLAGREADWQVARALLWTADLAQRGGLEVVAVAESNALIAQEDSGEELVLLPVALRTPPHRGGHPDDVARLVASLETVFLPRAFAVHLRQPLPEGFAPDDVAAAAFDWLRGAEDDGAVAFAAYDDPARDVGLDLDLLDGRLAGAGGAWFVAHPSRGPEYLGAVDRRLQRALPPVLAAHPDRPVVPVLVADPLWGLGRGFQCQWLYGTPREVFVCPDAGAQITWDSASTGFFADPVAARVRAVWWLEVGASPVLPRGWAHENPWTTAAGPSHFPGARLAHRDGGAALDAAWTSTPPSQWGEG